MMMPDQRAIVTLSTEGGPAETGHEPLPDLLGLSLAELRRLDHPVLSAVLDDLRERVVKAEETLWSNTSDPAHRDRRRASD